MDLSSPPELHGLMEFLNNPFVLAFCVLVFIAGLKFKKRLLSSAILGIFGYSYLFRLIPEGSGDTLVDLKKFFNTAPGSDLTVFIGGMLVITFGIVYIITRKD